MARFPLVVSTALLAAACAVGDAPSDRPAVTVRDSAGIAIVENPPWSTSEPPRILDDAPSLEIGVLDGDPAYQFHRVLDAARLPDGGLAVLDAGTHRVRFYGPDGTWRVDVGGEGDGPGEFRDARALVRWPGDSLGVWDRRTRRLTLVDATGALGRDLPLGGLAGMNAPTLHATLSGPLLVLSAMDFGFAEEGPGDDPQRPDVRIAAVDPAGEAVVEFGVHPGENTLIRASPERVEVIRNPYQPSWAVAALDSGVVVADTDRPELRWYDRTGRLARIVRLHGLRRPFTPEARSAEIEARVADAPEPARAGMRRMYELLPLPDTLPTLDRLLPDRTGGLWLRRFHLPTSVEATEWWMLDPAGRATGRIVVSAGFELFEVGSDYVVGRLTDELGVERVQVRPLRH